MNDLQGAIEPMAKLVKLNPDNPQYKALLAGINERATKGGKMSDVTKTSTEKSKSTTK
jgi:hypothetical protein